MPGGIDIDGAAEQEPSRPPAPDSTGGENGRSELLAATFPALVVAALGLWRLTGPALWADELATWGAVRLSWSQLWQLSGSVDAVLTPYYVLMKLYTDLAGTSTAALRLPSVVAITAATLVVTALGRRLGGARLGLLAGSIFAVLPVTSRYAQEARGYSFVILGAAVALLYLTRLVDRPGRDDLVGYAAAVGMTGLLHPLNGLLMLTGHAAAMLWSQLRQPGSSWRVTRRWAMAAAIGVLPTAVLSVRGSGQTAQVSWINLITLRSLPMIPERLFLSATVGGLVLALAVLGVRRTPQRMVVAAAAFVPMGVLFVAGTQLPVWVARYVLVVLPALAVLAAAALTRFGRAHAVAALGLAAVLAYPSHVNVRAEAGHGQASLRIEPVISPRHRPGDVAVFPDTHYSIPWSPRDVYERYLPAPRPPDVLRTAPQRTDGRFLATECPDATCLGTPPRIWVIRADNSPDPLKDMAPAKRDRIAADYRIVQRWQQPLLGITLMTRRGG